MFIPIPVLIAIAIVMIFLILRVARRDTRRDALMGGQRTFAPPLRTAASVQPSAAPMPSSLSPEVETQIRALMAGNRKIEAIKLAREATGLGLKDSKDLVESLPG